MSFSIFPIKGGIEEIDGIYCDGLHCGLKSNNKLDLGFIYSDVLFDIQALFTKNKFKAAPLKHYNLYEKDFKTDFLLINSKNANALTSKKGLDDINTIFDKLKTNIKFTNPIMSSTGVIGEYLPIDKIVNKAKTFDLKSKNSDNLSKAIMTTDVYPKSCLYEVCLDDGSSFKIGAVAKGAGMIDPNLATMLCFIVTDANIPKCDMKELLIKNNHTTFNAISVDGDTSTNDSIFLLANKKSKVYNKDAFDQVLKLVMKDIAFLILGDGEGATKKVAFEVRGAKSYDDALIASKKLSNSLLVKTALFGQDPNFGRIASTIGASGITCDEDKLTIYYNDIIVFQKGEILFCKDIEKKAFEVLQNSEFKIICDIGLGEYKFTSYGCDLGHEYIKINSSYRS